MTNETTTSQQKFNVIFKKRRAYIAQRNEITIMKDCILDKFPNILVQYEIKIELLTISDDHIASMVKFKANNQVEAQHLIRVRIANMWTLIVELIGKANAVTLKFNIDLSQKEFNILRDSLIVNNIEETFGDKLIDDKFLKELIPNEYSMYTKDLSNVW